MSIFKLEQLKDLPSKEIRAHLKWAHSEIIEYTKFIVMLEKELKRRK